MKRILLFAVLLSVTAAWADTQIATDDFHRADGSLGSNWTTPRGTWAISGNTATVSFTSSWAAARYTASSFTNDQYVTWTAATWVPGVRNGVLLRGNSSGQGYGAYCSMLSFGACYKVQIVLASGLSGDVGTFVLSPPAEPGTNITVKVSGNSFTVWVGGVQQGGAAIDSTYTTGSPGLYAGAVYDNSAGITYWEAGNVGGGATGNTAAAADSLTVFDYVTATHSGINHYTPSTADAVNVSDSVTASKQVSGAASKSVRVHL